MTVFSVQMTVLAVLAVLGLVVGWLHSEDFQIRSKHFAETLIEAETGEQLSLTHVRVSFWPPGLEVDGFHLFSTESDETIVSAERIRVPLVLTGGGVQIGRIRLQRPDIHLHLDEKGKLVEFRNRKQKPPTAKPGKPLERLPFTSLDIEDAAFRLTFPDGEVAITGFDSTPVEGAVHDLTGTLELHYKGIHDTSRIEIPGVILGPTTIEVPQLSLDTALLTLDGKAMIPLQDDMAVTLSGQVQLDAFTEALEEPWATHGFVDLDVEVSGRTQNPAVAVNAFGTHLGIDRPGRFGLLTYELGDVAVAATATRDRVDVEDLTLYWGGGTIRATGLIDPVARKLVDARAIGTDVSLHDLLQAFDAAPTPWIDLRADAELRASGDLVPLGLTGTFDFAVADLRVGDRPVRAPDVELMLDIPYAWARGDVFLDKEHIVLDASEVHGPKTRGTTRADIGFKPHGPLDLTANVFGADLSDFQPLGGVELSGTGEVSGRIWGPFDKLQFAGRGDIRDFSVLDIPWADRLVTEDFSSPDMKSLELHGAVAKRGRSEYGGDFVFDFKPPMSMHTDLTMPEGRIEDILSAFIDLPGMTGDMKGRLSLHGPIFDMSGGGHFQFADIDLWGEHFETGEGHGFMDEGLFTLDDLRLLRHQRREGLVLRGSIVRDWKLNMDLVGDGFTLETLDRLAPHELPLSGKADLNVRIDNTLFDPAPHGRIRVREVRYAGNPVDDSVVTFETNGGWLDHRGRLFGGAAKTRGKLHLWDEQEYTVHADLAELPAHLFYPVAADGSPIHAVASGSVDIEGDFGTVWSPVGLQGTLESVDVRWGGHVLTNQSPWEYRQEGRYYTLSNFDLLGGRTDFRLAATGGDQLELDGHGVVDIDLLRALVPGLQRSEGTATIALEATGVRPDVETVVDVRVDADLLRYESVPVAFEEVEAHLQLTKDRYEILSARGGLGGGTVTLKGGIDADDWMPDRYDLRGEVNDAQVQWVETLPPAIGDATLRFDGPTGALLLHGEVDIQDMVFRDRIDWEDWVVEYRQEVMVDPAALYDEEPLFALNVHIVADRTVRLRNNVAEGLASADLRIIGDTTRPGLVGWARVEEGIVILQDREFQVDRGEINYNDPWTWDPDLDFDLITDIDSRSQRYRVNYQVFGPFSDWRTATRSDPALPQADVNALLWFGVTTDDLEQSGELSSAVAQGVADLLLTDLFASTQASELGEVPELLFDRIDVTTGVNARGEYSSEPRLVVEKRLEDIGDIDVTWEFNLGRPEDNYVRFDKRVGGVWSIAGWYATLQRNRTLRIGGAYGVDVTARWETD
ncbi:MAG: translocation/assembly module TamB domain-containing protein [Alphaproteobacteria bacterium]|nr:translocation/assembly module TamB domain-containing protein [Alphaproteobacteria bacterium]